MGRVFGTKASPGSGEMALLVQYFLCKHEKRNLILRTQLNMETENQLYIKLSSDNIHTVKHTHLHSHSLSHTYTQYTLTKHIHICMPDSPLPTCGAQGLHSSCLVASSNLNWTSFGSQIVNPNLCVYGQVQTGTMREGNAIPVLILWVSPCLHPGL